MISKPLSAALLVSSISLGMVASIKTSLFVFFWTFILDFATGILASWVEHKKMPVRVSVVKAISYFVFIALIFGFEKAFGIKTFSILNISDNQFTLTTIAIAFCSFIEFFSILENCKRSGFDIIGKSQEAAKKTWKIINFLKNGQSNTGEN
ncbi:phage holin family protein [Flavobacterium columnare]|uniref:phage holin family protein n=1 Tax=Flavobacterium columnare TaxID=996 RepID=UPI0040338878